MLMAVDEYKNRRIFNFRPLVLFAFAVVLGVICSIFAINFGVIIIFLPFLLFCFIGVLFIVAKEKTFYIYAFITATLFLLISLVCSVKIANIRQYEKFADYSDAVTAKIIVVKTHGDGYSYILQTPSFGGETLKCNAILFSDCKFEKGDVVYFYGSLTPINKNDLKNYLAENVGFYANYNGELNSSGKALNIFDRCYYNIKTAIVDNMGSQAPFALALITGDSSKIDRNELTNFRFSGVAHIFAVSGLHIGFLVGVLNYFCNLVKVKRLKKVILISLITIFYSGICGFTPSSLRATVMSVIYLIATATGRKYDFLNSISLSLIIVLFINPFDLLSIGFALSYACAFSIALFNKTFDNALRFYPQKLHSSVALCLSVQFGVAPLVCYYFGYTSVVSIFLNLLILPIINMLFPLLLVFAILSAVFPQIGFILKIPEIIICGLRAVVNFVEFDRLNLFINFNVPMLLIYYFIAIFASDKLNFSKNIKFGAVILSSLLMLIFAI